MSLAFCPHLAMDLPPCGGEAAKIGRSVRGHGIDLTPTANLRAPWIVLQGEADRECPASQAAAFVARTRGASLVRVPKVGHLVGPDQHWMTPLVAAYRTLAVPATASVPPPPSALTDLPVVEVAATGDDARFAILISGDGGWAGLDKEVAGALAARGIPVAGWDSLRYFWTARTPAGFAADLDRVLRFYAEYWHRSQALVIGYSQGADVLPFALNRLPPASRRLVVHAVFLNLGQNASFEFHVGSWIGNDDTEGLPIRPEAEKLAAATTLCIYGADETDSLCPRLGGAVRPLMLPGGHHFDGDYEALAATILQSARPPAAHRTPPARR
jgi:type IV secretory pathway VirJ component